MKKISFIIVLLSVLSVKAQLGITAGGSLLRPFGVGKTAYYGLGFGVEFANDDQSTIFINASIGLPKKDDYNFQLYANDVNTVPYYLTSTGSISNNIIAIEGGNRRYLVGDAFDYGFGLYGGTSYQILICRAKVKTDEDVDREMYSIYDESGAIIPASETVFSGGIGLHLGMKHQFARGVIFIEGSVSYQLLPFSSTGNAYTITDFARLNFRSMIGYRKDIWN